jgi:hypothetical protein
MRQRARSAMQLARAQPTRMPGQCVLRLGARRKRPNQFRRRQPSHEDLLARAWARLGDRARSEVCLSFKRSAGEIA